MTVEALDGQAAGQDGGPRDAVVAVPDPRWTAAIAHAVYGKCEVSARAIAAARRAPLGRTLAELEHARSLGLVDQLHPGFYWCTQLAGDLPVPQSTEVAAARWRGGRYLLASSRKLAETIPGSLLPPVRLGPLPPPDPTIVDAHSGYDWALLHRPVVMRVAADAARDAVTYPRFGLLAVELALAGIAGAMAAGNIDAWEALAQVVFNAAVTIGDRHGQGYGLEHLGKARKQQGQYEKARRTQAEALKLREQIRDVRGIICSTNALGLTLWALGEMDGARTMFEQAVNLADTCTDRDFAALARQNLAGVLLERPAVPDGTRTAAFTLLDQAAAHHAQVVAFQALADCHRIRARGLRLGRTESDLAAAVQAARDAVAAIDASGEFGLAGHEYAELARALNAAGDEAQARAWAETAIVLFHCAGNTAGGQRLREEFAHLALESEDTGCAVAR